MKGFQSYFLMLYLLLGISSLPYVARGSSIIRTNYEQCAVLNNRFYMNGGEVYYYNNNTHSQTRSYYSGLRFINQSDANMRIYHLETPSEVPVVAMGALWSDGKDVLYLFGGQYDTNPSSSTYNLPKEKNEVWSYYERNNSWGIAESRDTPSLRPAQGASLSVPGIQLGFYLGGWADNTTTAGLEKKVLLNGLTIFDMETRSFRTDSVPEVSNPFRVGGRLVYVPVGKMGVLLALGGCTGDPCEKYISFEKIDIYDIESGKWFHQKATSRLGPSPPAEFPISRYDFCAVSIPSWDRSSFSIYIWSGGRNSSSGLIDDVWILTLPMFIWIPVYTGPFERKGSACDLAHERFMMYSGGCGEGSNETYCNPIESQVGTYDLTVGTAYFTDAWHPMEPGTSPWATYSPAHASYTIGERIRGIIGGSDVDSLLPEPANITTPINGWDQEELGRIFSTISATDIVQRRSQSYLKAATYIPVLLLSIAITIFPLSKLLYKRLHWPIETNKKHSSVQNFWNYSIYAAIPTVQYSTVNPVSAQKRWWPWRPFTLRSAYLIFLILSSLSLLIAVELLVRHSQQPEDLPSLRDSYTEDSPPNQAGYFADLNERPRLGLYNFWDNETYSKGNDSRQKTRSQSSRIRLTPYFVWNYLPTIVTVIFGIFWGLCDSEVQRIEPYYQLHRENGALGQDSLSVDYHTFWAPLRIIQAIVKGHWACVISGIAYVIAFAVLPNLQNFLFSWEKRVGGTYTWTQNTFGFRVGVVDPLYGRVIEAMLGIEVVCGVLLLWIYHTRNTGLDGNPIGLAAVAGLISTRTGTMPSEEIGLGGIGVQANDFVGRRFRTVYAGGKFHLIEETTPAIPSMGTQSWKDGLRSCKVFKNKHLAAVISSTTTYYKALSNWRENLVIWRFLHTKLDVVPLATVTAILVITFCGSMFILVEMGKNASMRDYTLPLPPNLYLILGVFTKSIYELVEKRVRIIAPYRKLTINRYQRPKILWEDYTTTMPIYVIILAFRNGQGLLALVTSASLALEVWTVLLGSLQVSAGDYGSTTYAGDLFAVSMAVLCNIIALVSLAMVTSSLGSKDLPFQPTTIASVISLVSRAKMLEEDFQDIGFRKRKKSEKKLEKKRRRYGFAWTGNAGASGEFLTVDYEPLGDDYKP